MMLPLLCEPSLRKQSIFHFWELLLSFKFKTRNHNLRLFGFWCKKIKHILLSVWKCDIIVKYNFHFCDLDFFNITCHFIIAREKKKKALYNFIASKIFVSKNIYAIDGNWVSPSCAKSKASKWCFLFLLCSFKFRKHHRDFSRARISLMMRIFSFGKVLRAEWFMNCLFPFFLLCQK